MSQRNAPLGHHFHKIAKAELEPKIPPDAEDNDLPVKMAAFEKIINAQHPGSFPLKAYSAASGSINILYVTGLAARAMVKSELKAA